MQIHIFFNDFITLLRTCLHYRNYSLLEKLPFVFPHCIFNVQPNEKLFIEQKINFNELEFLNFHKMKQKNNSEKSFQECSKKLNGRKTFTIYINWKFSFIRLSVASVNEKVFATKFSFHFSIGIKRKNVNFHSFPELHRMFYIF